MCVQYLHVLFVIAWEIHVIIDSEGFRMNGLLLVIMAFVYIVLLASLSASLSGWCTFLNIDSNTTTVVNMCVSLSVSRFCLLVICILCR